MNITAKSKPVFFEYSYFKDTNLCFCQREYYKGGAAPNHDDNVASVLVSGGHSEKKDWVGGTLVFDKQGEDVIDVIFPEEND